MEKDLVRFLLAQRAITAQVGKRILPNKLPTNTPKPAIIYHKYFRQNLKWYQGKGAFRERYQLHLYAYNYDSAKKLEKAVVDSLNYHEGAFGTTKNVFIRVENVTDHNFEDTDLIACDIEVIKLE